MLPTPSDEQLFTARRPRGFLQKTSLLLFRPRTFFQDVFPVSESTYWLWVGCLILFAASFAAVRQEQLTNELADNNIPAAQTWALGLEVISRIALVWIGQALFLYIVPLVQSARAQFGTQLRLAVLCSTPLSLLSALQLLYWATGGSPGQPGVSGLLESWDTFLSMPLVTQQFVTSAASNLTVFTVWHLILLGFGVRYGLKGGPVLSVVIVILWMVVSLLVLTLLGSMV